MAAPDETAVALKDIAKAIERYALAKMYANEVAAAAAASSRDRARADGGVASTTLQNVRTAIEQWETEG